MVNYDKEGNGQNLCIKADFPAASIFKIVSAAAALESAGYTPDQTVFFQGRRHTLYGSSGESVGKYEAISRFLNRSNQCNILF
jgi:cell division protein FtsI/penicillin-binding protein 2